MFWPAASGKYWVDLGLAKSQGGAQVLGYAMLPQAGVAIGFGYCGLNSCLSMLM